MIPFITALLTTFLFIVCGSAMAKTPTYGAKLCANDPQFSCYTVQKGDTWETLFTDLQQRDLAMRINRKNTKLEPGAKIAVPNNINRSIPLDFAPLSKQITPSQLGEKTIVISIKDLSFGAYDEVGNLQHWGPVSAARGYCPDVKRSCHTVRGQFTIYRKEGSKCVSTKFPVGRGGAPMPYCMFFKGGFALHGSHDVPGYNDSHGCVRLFVSDAKWLNEDFSKDANGVRVVIN